MRIVSAGGTESGRERRVPWWFVCALILGLYLSARGYHSFDGDQAYRLPLLLHRQEPRLYEDDPFVRALDAFNPHRGSLIVLDAVTRPLGLSAGLFVLFALTFLLTCRAVERLACAVWPESGPNVGWVAVVMLLAAKAGNIGTNHLFEAMVLDRLIAFALGWQALAHAVSNPEDGWWRPPVAIGLATWIHPTVGLQLAMVLAASWLFWSLLGQGMGVSARAAFRGLLSLIFAVMPGLAINLPRGTSLVGELPGDVFWLLSVELQNPQHMLPHLWRMPQWLSWSCYLVLALLELGSRHLKRTERARGAMLERFTFGWRTLVVSSRQNPPEPPLRKGGRIEEDRPLSSPPLTKGGFGGVYSHRPEADATQSFSALDVLRASSWPPARRRLAVTLGIILASLAIAWFAIEAMHQVRVTIYQPFRMATLARGIAIVIIAGRLTALWRSNRPLGRIRAILLATGFLGDWLLVVVTSAELTVSVVEAIESRLAESRILRGVKVAAFLGVLGQGLNFLSHHDTESGNRPLLIALIVGLAVTVWGRWRGQERPPVAWAWLRTSWTLATAMAAAWLIPVAALLAAVVSTDRPSARNPVLLGLIDRCRFIAVPVDDIERLALWCRENTPRTAMFVGPPGPKTFRLWARRSVAFNRAASPYHAAGLADWFARFQDHVDFHAPPAEFVRAYLAARHRFEARYQALSDAQRAALAVRQGASYVVAAAPAPIDDTLACDQSGQAPPLELLHVEGRYAVYRVSATELVHRHR